MTVSHIQRMSVQLTVQVNLRTDVLRVPLRAGRMQGNVVVIDRTQTDQPNAIRQGQRLLMGRVGIGRFKTRNPK